MSPGQQKGLVLLFAVFAFVGGLAIAYTLDLLITRPVGRMVDQVRLAAERGWGEPITVPPWRAELTELGGALEELRAAVRSKEEALSVLNSQLEERVRIRGEELEAAQVQLVEAAKLAGLGQMASGVAHEVNNPTGIILSRVGYLLSIADEEGLDPDIIEDLSVVEHQARRVARITQDLLNFGRETGQDYSEVSLSEVVDLTLSLLGPVSKKTDVLLTANLDGSAVAWGNRDQLEQVVFNLVKNALEASAPGGEVVVTTRPGEIVVEDGGDGIPADEISRIFEPFFTRKPVGEGTGLGLSVSYGIVTRHGGRIEVDSEEGAGTTMTVSLPLGGS
jgi:signal transduction histidine kinase